jgi:large subunit ribosomal protein L5
MAEEKKVKPKAVATNTDVVKKPRKPKVAATPATDVVEKPVVATANVVVAKPEAAPVKEVAPKAKEVVPVKEVAPKAKEVAPKAKEVAPAKASKSQPLVKLNSRLQVKYFKEIRPELFKTLKFKSIMQVPKVEKIVVNVGVGDATGNAKLLEESVKELTDITGQKPVITKSKKSIATFKLRENQAIGTKVTLRGVKMYQFLDKLVSIALPRVRDFRGVSRNSFDGRGNYTLGIKEQLIFPEINFDRVNKIRGMDIVIVTTAQNDEQAYALLQALGMPFNR